jgi:glycosyltransferase involved in cell wall biosynthesis
MRIVVASAFEASSQWAHAINTVKMAQGFSRLGHDVTLLCRQSPTGKTPSEKLAQMYGLREQLRWIQLPRKLLRCHVDEHWRFALLSFPIVILMQPDLIFARNYILPWLTSKCGITTVVESHAYPGNNTAPFSRLVGATHHQAFRLWITISDYLAAYYCSIGVPAEKLVVLPTGVDFRLFRRPRTLPQNPYNVEAPVATYIGHLYDYKGIPTILETASILPDVQFHLIGGWPEDIVRQKAFIDKKGLRNVILHGSKPQNDIPAFLWHADVLLLPPSANHPSAQWTGPVKLGEYLASGTPTIATSIPALRQWLTAEEVEFVPPDDSVSLAQGIQKILSDSKLARLLSKAGPQKAQQWAYEIRAKRIMKMVKLH